MSYADIGLAAVTGDPHADLHAAFARAEAKTGGLSTVESAQWLGLIGLIFAVPAGLLTMIVGGGMHLEGKPGGARLAKQGAVVTAVGVVGLGGFKLYDQWKRAQRDAAEAAKAAPGAKTP